MRSKFGPAHDAKQRAALWSALLASNLPDLDFVLGPLSKRAGNLGYLLHHRGFTHTIGVALPLAVISTVIGLRIARAGREARMVAFVAGLTGVLLHLVADGWNDYGVHPLAPWVNRWFYGDFVFILEPALWFALIPAAVYFSRSNRAKVAWAALAPVVILFGLVSGFISWIVALGLSVWAGSCAILYRLHRGVLTAVVLGCAVLGVFAWGGAAARSRLRDELHSLAPREELLDLVTSPAPGNPFCWRAIVATVDRARPSPMYLARIGILSLAPGVFSPERCHRMAHSARTAPLFPVMALRPSDEFYWVGRFEASIVEMRKLAKTSCLFSDLLRFARIPFWVRQGESVMAGDLRYDHEAGLGFSEIEVRPGEACVGFVPPWERPRQALLEEKPEN